MKKHKQPLKSRILELKKETVVLLTHDQLKPVVGGTNTNTSITLVTQRPDYCLLNEPPPR